MKNEDYLFKVLDGFPGDSLIKYGIVRPHCAHNRKDSKWVPKDDFNSMSNSYELAIIESEFTPLLFADA